MSKDILAYVPVLHEGYRQFFDRHRDANVIWIFSSALIQESDYLYKEIRALDPGLMSQAIKSVSLLPVGIAGAEMLQVMNRNGWSLVMPDEDVCHQVAERHLTNCNVTFDSMFLRWDRKNILQEQSVTPHRTIAVTDVDKELIGLAFKKAQKSSDWWRQVGAVAACRGSVLLTAYNRHMPSPHTPYSNGDPRNALFHGVHIEFGTVLHAEKAIICEAAKRGIRLDGAYLYVSTFPCPPCAKAIVAAGFWRCYYSSGYAMLDGESILQQSGVEVVYVPLP